MYSPVFEHSIPLRRSVDSRPPARRSLQYGLAS